MPLQIPNTRWVHPPGRLLRGPAQWLSGPWILWLCIPIVLIALIALVAIPSLMPAGKTQRGSVDIAGAISVAGGFALAVFAIIRAPQQGLGIGSDARRAHRPR